MLVSGLIESDQTKGNLKQAGEGVKDAAHNAKDAITGN